MEAVLYIGHGTRVSQGVQEALDFIERGKRGVHASIQEVCFLELVEPDIIEGVRRCVEKGATVISVVPILLLTAMHAKSDIPDELEKAKRLYPHITFKYGRPFGVHEKITQALVDRIHEKDQEPGTEDMVLIVGRGSSDPDVKRDLTQIAENLEKLHSFKKVSISFMFGAAPRLRNGLVSAQAIGAQKVFIVPYLLFSGLVMRDIEEEIAKLPVSDQQFILCESLGYHPNIVEVLQERTNELLVEQPAEVF